ncbi:phosphotriesterase family protein [Allonocardiopsis opalescens]|uniref:Phosphotriesterase-related protein n=1 Tax=Allonocardiopsis opalescens TaxID=1144618 RepID=A0A2T0Q0D6_9ACTN|nr:aryldialkylphosphatase [Allonocardiopsis opalescens]PRX97262.1 phosphotriesterase-related protein [Allonocardiopsis opalescens]
MNPTGRVRTVLADIEPGELGRTDYHEHLTQVSPLLPGDELDDEERSGAEAASLRAAGIDAMVEATPTGLGRDVAAIARIAAATGLNIVATTGAHREAHYRPGDPLPAEDAAALAARFTADLTVDARPGSPGGAGAVRAGLLKAGAGYWSVSPFERRVLDAVAAAHRATGAPVMVHLEHGSAAFELLAVLAEGGVPASAVALAHMDRNPDPGLHAELCEAGAYLGYDGMARHRERPDSELIACLLATVERAGPHRLLLGGDVARRTRYRAYGGMPGLDYLPRRFLPRLAAEGGAELVDTLLAANPAAWLTWRSAA